MKKLTSLILALTLILPCISLFALDSFADTGYDKLWEEKMNYEKKGYNGDYGLRYTTSYEDFAPRHYGDIAGEGGDSWGIGYDFILFTEQGQKLTYNYYSSIFDSDDFKGADFSVCWNPFGGDCLILCEELQSYFEELNTDEEYGLYKSKSKFRLIVQKLKITADELREAYRKMKTEPQIIRDIIPELTDNQFKKYTNYLKTAKVPENFMIEAACMEDDEKGETLLNYPGMVYIKELGYSVWSHNIFQYNYISVEQLSEFDLTTDSFSLFLEDIKNYFESADIIFFDRNGAPDSKGRTPRERFKLLYTEYKKQLANPKTGDSVYLIPVAVVSFTIGVYFVYPRKKRNLEV